MPTLRVTSFVLCLLVARTALADDPGKSPEGDSGAPRAASESTAAFPVAVPTGDASAQREPVGPAPVPAPPTRTTTVYTDTHSTEPDPRPTFPAEKGEGTRKRSRWYGGQTLAVDGASAGLLLAAAGTGFAPLAVIAGLGYAVGPPIVHFTHGRVAAGFGSLGLRVGLPFVGGALGAAATAHCHDEETYCRVEGAAIGMLIGLSAAITIDAAVLARETVNAKEPVPMSTLHLMPVFDPHRGTAGLGVAGTF